MDDNKTYSVEEVAEQLNTEPATIRGLIRAGRLRTVRVKRVARITQSDLDDFLAQNGPPAAADPEADAGTGAECSLNIDDFAEDFARLEAIFEQEAPALEAQLDADAPRLEALLAEAEEKLLGDQIAVVTRSGGNDEPDDGEEPMRIW